MDVAGEAGARSAHGGRDLLLKAHLRNPAYLPFMRDALTETFGEACVAYLQADICRADLLVEVEGMYFLDRM